MQHSAATYDESRNEPHLQAPMLNDADARSIGSGTRHPAAPKTLIWTVDALHPDSPTWVANLNGVAVHGDKTGKAMLQVMCNHSEGSASISLLAPTDRLHFKTDIYEGKEASSTGPLSITTDNRPTRHYAINGYHIGGSLALFTFITQVNQQALSEWATENRGGQLIRMKLTSAIPDDGPLTAEFVLPHDSAALREVIDPCLTARKKSSHDTL
ncbi:hypothetical protein PFWH6_0352 [Pseudomonas fluorescens WH6]|nr:hypothetical protein PFWH6_0352 [Pseudomonas fluorescens WH6]